MVHDAALLCAPFITPMHSILLNSSIVSLTILVEEIIWPQSKELKVVRSGDLGGHSTVLRAICLLNFQLINRNTLGV